MIACRVLVLALLAAAGANAQPLPDLIAELRRQGVVKVLQGERHRYKEQNLELIRQLIEGGLQVGPMSLWRECGRLNPAADGPDRPANAEYKRRAADPGDRQWAAVQTAAHVAWPWKQADLSNPEYMAAFVNRPEVQRFVNVVSNSSLSLSPLNFVDPACTPITDFLGERGFAVGSMGGMHSHFDHEGRGMAVAPWGTSVDAAAIGPYSRYTAAMHREMVGAFTRSIAAGYATVLVHHPLTFRGEASESDILGAYRRLGYAAAEVPIDAHQMAFFVLQPQFVPTVARVMRRHQPRWTDHLGALVGLAGSFPSPIVLHCAGIVGCPQDEL